MDANNILESMLADGKSIAAKAVDKVGEHIDLPAEGSERDAMVSGMQKGALAAGVLAILLGTRAGRRVGGAAVKVGSVAALGGLAYNAWQRFQTSVEGGKVTRVSSNDYTSAAVPVALDKLSGDERQTRSVTILRVMIAAARADGHIDSEEKKAIMQRMGDKNLDDETLAFLRQEIESEVDLDTLAGLANSPAAAAEMYLAASTVVDQASTVEKAWLNDFQRALNLSAGFVNELKTEMSAA